MDFIQAINTYPMIQRIGWNGNGLFVFQQIPSEIPIFVVLKMQSLPEAVKDEFARRFEVPMTKEEAKPFLSIRYNNQLAIVDKENNINGWAPSVSDALAEDWIGYIPEV
jgi:hypothetical protein